MRTAAVVIALAAALAVGVHAIPMTKVLLSDYVSSYGAMCLDGTAPAYYFHRSQSAGANAQKWIVYFEGGGWCYDEDQCVGRAGTDLGSSKNYPDVFDPGYEGGSGLLSNDSSVNPSFWDWNFAYIRYCDGASYAGNVADPVVHNGFPLHFRGIHNLRAVLDHLTTRMGMDSATEAILAGCSAGGLATYVHCDGFADYMAKTSGAPVKCMPDGGFFVDVPSAGSPSGKEMVIREDYTYVFNMQNASAGVNQRCIAGSPGSEWQCFFPQYTMNFMETPVFVLNSGYDSWQTSNIWFAGGQNGVPPPPQWAQCANAFNCTADQMPVVQSYHSQTLSAMAVVLDPTTPHGAFVDSCWVHCQSSAGWDSTTIGGQTMMQTFDAWYHESVPPEQSKRVMCPFPCNEAGSRC